MITKIKKSNTKVYSLSLREDVVKEARKSCSDMSFSKYLSDLIEKDLQRKKQVKTMKQIFGKDFTPITFNSEDEKRKYYTMINADYDADHS
jgi:hypothetical protein